MEHVLFILGTNGVLELFLIMAGFAAGRLSQWTLPIQFLIFVINVFRWYIKTHPHGIEISKHTNIHNELDNFLVKSGIVKEERVG